MSEFLEWWEEFGQFYRSEKFTAEQAFALGRSLGMKDRQPIIKQTENEKMEELNKRLTCLEDKLSVGVRLNNE